MLNTEDYLGIIALALSNLAEKYSKSIDPSDVRPLLMELLIDASIRWGDNSNWGNEYSEVKDRFVAEVKGSVDEVHKWRTKGEN